MNLIETLPACYAMLTVNNKYRPYPESVSFGVLSLFIAVLQRTTGEE